MCEYKMFDNTFEMSWPFMWSSPVLSIYQHGASQQSPGTVIRSKSVAENKNHLIINILYIEIHDETLLPMELTYSIDKLNFQRSQGGQDDTLEWSFVKATHFRIVFSTTEMYSWFSNKGHSWGLTDFFFVSLCHSISLSFCLIVSLSLFFSFWMAPNIYEWTFPTNTQEECFG